MDKGKAFAWGHPGAGIKTPSIWLQSLSSLWQDGVLAWLHSDVNIPEFRYSWNTDELALRGLGSSSCSYPVSKHEAFVAPSSALKCFLKAFVPWADFSSHRSPPLHLSQPAMASIDFSQFGVTATLRSHGLVWKKWNELYNCIWSLLCNLGKYSKMKTQVNILEMGVLRQGREPWWANWNVSANMGSVWVIFSGRGWKAGC